MYAEISKLDNMVRIVYRDNGETESCNKLKINSMGEFLSIYKSAPTWYNINGSDDIYAPYIGDLKIAVDKLSEKRSAKYRSLDVDMQAKFTTGVSGESKLVFRPGSGTIHLALRKADEKTSSINSLCIPNLVREEFISDCRKAGKIKYVINRKTDEELFKKWGNKIRAEYIKQYLKYANKENINELPSN